MSVVPLRLAAMAACSVLVLATAALAQEYQTALQVSPEWGSRCITVPNGAVAPDQGLAMLDCNNSPAQTFTYDQAKMRLTEVSPLDIAADYHVIRCTSASASKCSSRLSIGNRCCTARAAIQASFAGIGRPNRFRLARTAA